MAGLWINRLGVYQETRAQRGRSAVAWRHEVGFDAAPPPHLVLPETRLSLVTETRFDAHGDIVEQREWIFGPIETPRIHAPAPGTRLEGHYVAPEDAQRILGLRPDEITDAILPARDFGLSRIHAPVQPGALDGVSYAARLIRASRGQARMEAVADRVGMSVRHLRRSFRRRTGLAPKTLARRLQVQAAIERADACAQPAWADIALASGFSDQAHLSRSIRELTGHSPARLHAQRRRQSDFFNIPA